MVKTKKAHLVLKYKWFDKIQDGSKRTEYRNNTARYRKMLLDATHVILHRGYTKTTMEFVIRFKAVRLTIIELHLGTWIDDPKKDVYVV